MKRTVLVLALLVMAGLGAPVVRFAVIGDRTGNAQPGVYESIVAEIERLRPDFVFTVGDQSQGYTKDTAVLGQQWREYRSIMAGLLVPLYITAGNHDIRDESHLGPFLQYHGRPYYSLKRQGLYFIVLDNSRWEASSELPKEQLDWLQAELGRSRRARYTFVFMHKPFWENSTARGRPDTLHSLFRRYGVDAVFAGHRHQYFSGLYDGISYTAVGSSGGATSPGPTGILYHFTWVTVDDAGIHIAPILAGAIRPWNDVTAADRQAIEKNEREGLRFPAPVPVDGRLAVNGDAELMVANFSATDTLIDTLRWEVPAGWSVEPDQAVLTVAPGATTTVTARVACAGRPFPVPIARVRLPYRPGRTSLVSRQLRVARTAVSSRLANIVIDGRLTEREWQQPESCFFGADGGPAETDSTRFYFGWDDSSLYVSAVCFDPAVTTLKAQAEQQDEAVYNDDCVGFFLHPDTSTGVIYQIYFNPKGVVFDQQLVAVAGGVEADPKWNGSYTVATALGPDRWSIEARIPLGQLGAKVGAGQVWGLNFRRKQPGRKANGDWQPISYDRDGLGRLLFR